MSTRNRVTSVVSAVPTPAQIEDVFAQLTRLGDVDAYHASLLAVDCGLRRKEIIELRWRDIDFDDRAITICISTSRNPRTVPMTDRVVGELRARCGETGSDAYVLLPDCPRLRAAAKLASALKKTGSRLGVNIGLRSLRWRCALDFAGAGASKCAITRMFGYRCPRRWDCLTETCRPW